MHNGCTMGSLLLIVTLALLVRCQSQEGDFYRVTYNITEEQEPGIFVGNTALDTGLFNSGSNQGFQNLNFELFDNGNDKARFFSIDEQNGVVRTRERIDREAVCGNKVECTMILDMAVYRKTSQAGTFDFYKSIQVVIRVEDKNDNAPEFPEKVVPMSMPENMPAPYRLSTTVATDPDRLGPNSDITYTFQADTNLFELEVKEDSDTGLTELAIKVREMLDREAVDSYYVTIVASDNGSPRQSGSVLINIAVTDTNDNAPVFMNSNYSVNVNENASIREPILTVSAVDRDINDNGQVLYKLGARVSQDIRDHFRIGETDGKVYLTRPVDYETVQTFVFLVEAVDRGTPSQSSAAYVIVNIIDVNDNAPEISLNLSPEGTDIKEHTAAGKFLGHISVSDKDSGVHGDVVCEIDDPNFRLEPFDGQPDIYKIVLEQPLDHEDLAVRQVTIRCRDSDKNPLLATKTFEVKVLDINDNYPRFTRPTFAGAVLENQPAGTNVMMPVTLDTADMNKVLRIVADDSDSGEYGRVTYSIPARTNFSIDSLTGTLSTLVTFDREAQSEYTFTVVAQDHGDDPKSATATVIVHIQDQNDHPPHFTRPIYLLEVLENMPPGSACGRIMAVDEDTGPNARMVYTIARDFNNSRYFSVDRDTGEVTTNQMFDRESRDSYTFSLEVQNPSVPAYKDSVQVRVSVLDDNDHVPVITSPSSTNTSITLPNNTTVGSLIIKVEAEDGDDPKNVQFEFTISGSHRGDLFQIITVTGDLILAREIRAEDAKVHKVLLVVSDGGSNPSSATTTMLITIPAEGLRNAQKDILREPNFIIIIVIIIVTLLVAVLVVTVICCIFRRDRKRRAGRQHQRQVKDKMYHAAQWVSTHSLPHGEPNGSSSHELMRSSDTSCADRKTKKEVSFSLEESLEKEGEGDPDTSGSLGSVFSPPTAITADNNNLKPPSDGRFITFVSGKSSPQSPTPTPSCYGSSDGHTYSNTPPIAETEDHMHMQLERPGGEDALSASSGETGTDSGRGGSEDEAHSHRTSSLESDPRHYQPVHPHNGSGYCAYGSSDRSRRKPISLSSLPEEEQPQQPTPHDHALHPRSQHGYFGSSAEHLPVQGLNPYPTAGATRACSFNARDNGVSRDSGPRDNYYSMDRGGRDGPFRLKDMSQPQQGRRTFHTFGPQHQNQQSHPAWRRAKGLDGGWRSVTPSNASYANTDEDDRTTTSGSYTISPEEHPSDLEEVNFHQVHDIMV